MRYVIIHLNNAVASHEIHGREVIILTTIIWNDANNISTNDNRMTRLKPILANNTFHPFLTRFKLTSPLHFYNFWCSESLCKIKTFSRSPLPSPVIHICIINSTASQTGWLLPYSFTCVYPYVAPVFSLSTIFITQNNHAML